MIASRCTGWMAGCWLAWAALATQAAADDAATPLVGAVSRGDLALVEKLLASGADPNARVAGEQLYPTALFEAVKGSNPGITEALLKAGADPGVENSNHSTAMTFALRPNELDQARMLMKHGVSIDAKNSGGQTLLMTTVWYAEAADIKAILGLGASLEITDNSGRTALMNGASALNPGAVKVLLEAGAKLEAKDKDGQTALWAAAFGGRGGAMADGPATLNLLFKAGADLSLQDAEGKTFVMAAMDRYDASSQMIETLLAAKPDLSKRDKDGRNALFQAVGNKDFHPLIDRMIALGADPKIEDHLGQTLLMLAAGEPSPELVRKFLALGLSAKSRDHSGDSVMHYAAMATRQSADDPFGADEGGIAAFDEKLVEVFKLLKAAGADPLAPGDGKKTPLHWAAAQGSPTVLGWLLPHYPSPDVMDEEGLTPLHEAASAGQIEAVDLLLPKFRNPDPPDIQGATPLMMAATWNRREALLKLQAAGADINARDKEGKSALARTLEEDGFSGRTLSSARFLIEHGARLEGLAIAEKGLLKAARSFHELPPGAENYSFAIDLFAGEAKDLELRDEDGMTALMWVAASNVVPALEALLKRKPDLNARSPDGRSALMWAAAAEATATMKLLEEAGADPTLRDSAGRSAADWLAMVKDEGIPLRKVEPAAQEATALLERILRGRREALAEYLKRGTWKAEDRLAGSAPLHLAAALGDTAALNVLLEKGALPDQVLADGSTALMEAAGSGQSAALELLLKRGANATLRDESGQRALDRAVDLRHADAARLLLRHEVSLGEGEAPLLSALVDWGDSLLLEECLKTGAAIGPDQGRRDPLDRGGEDPSELLRSAARAKDPEMLRLLLRHPNASGAKRPLYLVAALYEAAEVGQAANVKLLIEEAKVDANVLLEGSLGGVTRIDPGKPTEAGAVAVRGFSALSRALEQGHEEIVRYLVERGAKITGRTRNGGPPLSFVVAHRQMGMLRYFLDHHADTELVDIDGMTALHHAAESGEPAAVQLLLEKGAKAGAKDSSGETPLDLARKKGSAEVIRLLEAAGKQGQ